MNITMKCTSLVYLKYLVETLEDKCVLALFTSASRKS